MTDDDDVKIPATSVMALMAVVSEKLARKMALQELMTLSELAFAMNSYAEEALSSFGPNELTKMAIGFQYSLGVSEFADDRQIFLDAYGEQLDECPNEGDSIH